MERGGYGVSGLFLSGPFYGKVFAIGRFASGTIAMPALARKFAPEPEPTLRSGHSVRHPSSPKRQRRMFHASALVTRLEEWFVEADSPEEARALLAAGEGHRTASGERVHLEVERLIEGAE